MQFFGREISKQILLMKIRIHLMENGYIKRGENKTDEEIEEYIIKYYILDNNIECKDI